ncbi:hypothetical protein A2U01_0119231, partial [Trifolium medium]|nr:hypothetical protein [Trifolium medium]
MCAQIIGVKMVQIVIVLGR